MRWSVGGFLLTDAIARLPVETAGAMRARVLAELTTAIASAYVETIGLADVLDPAHLTAFAKRSTGAKHLINPSLDRP